MAKLNMEKINSRITKIVSSEDALKDVIPIDWSDEVLSGEKYEEVTKVIGYKCSKCGATK